MNLKEKYNRDDFIDFLKGFLPGYTQDIRPASADNENLTITKDAYYLGESLELDLSIFELTHMSPRDARVALSNDGFKLMKKSAVYRALVIYQAEEGRDWRLSLMTIDPDINSKGKVIDTFSNPRRLSFFLGPNAKVRTPNRFLLKKGRVKDFDDLISCFDVEVVEKEFFAHYKKLYEKVRKYFDKDHAFAGFASRNNINLDAFAKKLLGQIVFCYFLQRKGWLGAPKGKAISEGDRDFMRSMFVRFTQTNKNFFNDCLEYLFYGSLNRPSDSSASFYRSHFDCQIPFLNGGLFEPLEDYDWEKEFLYIPDGIFSNKEKTGILDIFDLYNFTVYEDDPTDREVAVDPEMLGKVFENLLDENLRKGQGAFYTPREIVHYMCKESLINHLMSDSKVEENTIRALVNKQDCSLSVEDEQGLKDLLSNIKICDPACGSGAFLVGMLNEIISAKRQLNQGPEHLLKKETIENSIYGVDIDLGAVEIAKLRLWLSLVVDYELEDIEPLPNLDYKIMCGNSLVEELIIGDDAIQLFDPDLIKKEQKSGTITKEEREKIVVQIKQKQKEYINLKQNGKLSEKGEIGIEDEIKRLQKQIEPKRTKKSNLKRLDQMSLFEEKSVDYFNSLRELHRKYFREHNSEKKKQKREQINEIEYSFIRHSIDKKIREIDSHIKNLNMNKPEDRKKNSDLLKKKLDHSSILNHIKDAKKRPYFLWHLNYFEVFQEKGGFDVIVGNPPYFNLNTVKKEVVQYLSNHYKCIHTGYNDIVYYFIYSGIELLNDLGTCALITSNYFLGNEYAAKLRHYLREHIFKLINFKGHMVFNSASVHTCITFSTKQPGTEKILFYEATNDERIIGDNVEKDLNSFAMNRRSLRDNWIIADHSKSSLFNKILEKTTKLGEIANIEKGSTSGKNEVFTVSEDIAKKENFEHEIIRKNVKNGDIEKYYLRNRGTCLIYIDGKTDIKKYPNVYSYLNKHKNVLSNRNEVKKGLYPWYRFERPRKKVVFDADEKIIVPYRSETNRFAYDEEQYFNDGGDVRAIVVENKEFNTKYVLALLNSSMMDWWYGFVGKPKGKTREYFNKPLSLIPIKKINMAKQQPFIDVVEKILVISKSPNHCNDEALKNKIKEHQEQIDKMVYSLYDLTKEEITMIEEKL